MATLGALYITFFKIGLFTFGGGYAMLPMLERELVDGHGWVTREELLDYFAIGQCTPGIIAVNTATLVGYKQRKVSGSIAGTLGMITPSLIIITIIAAVLSNFADIPQVINAFAGIRVGVAALICSSVIKLFRQNVLVKGVPKTFMNTGVPIALAAVAFVLVAILGASPVFLVIGGTIAGLLLYSRKAPEKEA